MLPLLVAFLAAGCARSFAENADASLRGALTATGVLRDIAVDASKRAQERTADELEAAAAALPPDVAERGRRIEVLKDKAKADVAAARRDRDRVLDACARAYRAIALAEVLLPLAEADSVKRTDVLRLMAEAYEAIEAAK